MVCGEEGGWVIPRSVGVILCTEHNKFFCTYIYTRGAREGFCPCVQFGAA